MPYSRPTLPQIIQLTQSNIASRLAGSNPWLPFSTLQILAMVFAGNQYALYSYLDWISKQAIPVTATDESLNAWAALKGVTLNPAVPATGMVQFSGVNGTLVPTGTVIVRADGMLYSAAGGTISGGVLSTQVVAATPGLLSNMAMGDVLSTSLAVQTPIAGVNSTVLMLTDFTGGVDVESQDSLRSRMIEAFSNPVQGGAVQDYVTWSLQLPGTTRAWAAGPEIMGAGTVSVYFMRDDAEAAFDGIPQGTNGGSQYESRIVTATGDQLSLADHLYPLRAATALVWAFAPVAVPLDIVLSEVPDDAELRQRISDAVAAFCRREATPGGVRLVDLTTGGTIRVSHLEAAISAVPGLDFFEMVSPIVDQTVDTGEISIPPSSITYL